MGSCGVIVCERSGRVALALRREAELQEVPLAECRHLAECERLVARRPDDIVLLEVTVEEFGEAIHWLPGLERVAPRARAVAVADRLPPGAEGPLREAGAVEVVRTLRRLRPLVEVVARQRRRVAADAREDEDELWPQLPWSD